MLPSIVGLVQFTITPRPNSRRVEGSHRNILVISQATDLSRLYLTYRPSTEYLPGQRLHLSIDPGPTPVSVPHIVLHTLALHDTVNARKFDQRD